MPSREWWDAMKGMQCACVRDDGLDCAQARYGDTDEPCDCCCHYGEPEGWEEARFHALTGPPLWKPDGVVFLPGERVKRK